eukprot:TRINITY_DN4198_c0_g1_i2.p1 TRINITY_DN4198_c0_g1~~TRINITY_DN4198_c0_g1_i2.p1  ORF type:complete len:237 (+),score=58.07 TRINITY_DN4198_c0_g1_i2:228-938(+)
MIPGNYIELIEGENEGAQTEASLIDIDLGRQGAPKADTVVAAASTAPGDQKVRDPFYVAPLHEPVNHSGRPAGGVEKKIAALLGKAHQAGLSVREKVDRVDDRYNISTRIKEFDEKHNISDNAARRAQRVDEWQKDFKPGDKVDALGTAAWDKMEAFGEKHQKLRDNVQGFIGGTNKALEKFEKKASELGDRIADSSLYQAIHKKVTKTVAKVREKFANVETETKARVEANDADDR